MNPTPDNELGNSSSQPPLEPNTNGSHGAASSVLPDNQQQPQTTYTNPNPQAAEIQPAYPNGQRTDANIPNKQVQPSEMASNYGQPSQPTSSPNNVPGVSPGIEQYNQPFAGTTSKKRLKLKKAIIASLILLVVAGGIFLYLRLFSGLALTTFVGDGYALDVPKEYERTDEGGAVKFTEKTGDDSTRSFVLALAQRYPSPPTEQDKQELINILERQIQSLISQGLDEGERVENISSQKIIHDGRDALRITADLTKGDKKARLDMMVIVGDFATYMAAVGAHQEDEGITKAANKIITSLIIDE